jgi:hypothetical protein
MSLNYSLGFADLTMNDSTFQAMWVLELGSADNDLYE